MRLDTCAVELRRFVAQDVARQEHAGCLAADAARTDLAVFDVQQVAHGEIFPAQGKARRLVAEQAAEHILLEAFSVCIRRLVPVGDGESNMLSQQSRRSPVWVKRSKTA